MKFIMAAPPLVDDRDIFIGGGEALHPLLRGSFARGHLHYIEGGGRGHVRLSTNNIPPPFSYADLPSTARPLLDIALCQAEQR